MHVKMIKHMVLNLNSVVVSSYCFDFLYLHSGRGFLVVVANQFNGQVCDDATAECFAIGSWTLVKQASRKINWVSFLCFYQVE
jgi:hypothetical protein